MAFWRLFSVFKQPNANTNNNYMVRTPSEILVHLIHANAHSNHAAPEVLLQSVRQNANGRVIALDIDKTSCLGNDTNDILLLVSFMTEVFSKSTKQAAILSLLRLLVNPEVLDSICKIRSTLQCEPYIVFYTMKGGIVTECIEQNITNDALFLQPHNILTFKPGGIEEGAQYLCNQIDAHNLSTSHPVIYQHLCRVGILTWAISEILGLGYAAPVYITRAHKDMRLISNHLNVDFSKCFLFDDSSEHHALQLRLRKEEAHMISTQPFDFDTMSDQQKEALHRILSEHFVLDSTFKTHHESLITTASQRTAHLTMPAIINKDWIRFHEMYPSHKVIESWPLQSVINDDYAKKG